MEVIINMPVRGQTVRKTEVIQTVPHSLHPHHFLKLQYCVCSV